MLCAFIHLIHMRERANPQREELQKASSYKRESSQLTMTKSMDVVTIVGAGVQLG